MTAFCGNVLMLGVGLLFLCIGPSLFLTTVQTTLEATRAFTRQAGPCASVALAPPVELPTRKDHGSSARVRSHRPADGESARQIRDILDMADSVRAQNALRQMDREDEEFRRVMEAAEQEIKEGRNYQ